MSIKQLAMRLVYGHKASSEQYISWLRSQGVHVGQHVHLYTPWSIRIDTQRPWMIEIGDNVHITADCSILQHDYSWAVIQRLRVKCWDHAERFVLAIMFLSVRSR